MTIGNYNGIDFDEVEVTGERSDATCTMHTSITLAHTMNKNFTQGDPYPYDVIIDCEGRYLADVYEYLKFVTREDSTYQMYPLYEVTGGSTLAREVLDGEEYIQAYRDEDTTNTYAPVKASPFGTFAGGVFFGARGVWVEDMHSSDSQNFQLIDSNGTTRTPPNFQDVTVTGLEVGDTVSVFILTGAGGTINKAAFTSAAGNGANDPDFVVKEAIPTHTPSSGFIRVVRNSATPDDEQRYQYDSWDSGTKAFTLNTTAHPTGLTYAYTEDTDTAYVPFIDRVSTDTEETETVIYTSNVAVLTRVRKKGILPFQAEGTFGSTGITQGAIRTTDSIVT
jgi:hypothetical protein